ncbi:hypothetical protein BDU57DRAFT_465592, partial [Ampelomyces quisqualis]
MLRIDGISESKPTAKSTISPSTTSARTESADQPKRRKRFTSLFGSQPKSDANVSVLHGAMEDKPMRTLSPRATDSAPPPTNTPSNARRHTFLFRRRKSTGKSTIDAGLMPALSRTEEWSPEIHIPVTDLPCQAPMRKDSVAMPKSPTKEMALHSHPVTRRDEAGSDTFATPMSGRSGVLGRS